MRFKQKVGLLSLLSLFSVGSIWADALLKISNPTSDDLQNVQVRIDLSKLGISQKLFDVLSGDQSQEYKFCYEQSNGECNTNATSVIWVKIPDIPANGETQIYLKYTSSNYASSGGDVFDFYDDFDYTDETYLTAKWEVHRYSGDTNNECVLKDGYLILTTQQNYKGCNIVAKDYTFDASNYKTDKLLAEFKFKINYACDDNNADDGDGLTFITYGKYYTAYNECTKGVKEGINGPSGTTYQGIAFDLFNNGKVHKGIRIGYHTASCSDPDTGRIYSVTIDDKLDDLSEGLVQLILDGTNSTIVYFDTNPANGNNTYTCTRDLNQYSSGNLGQYLIIGASTGGGTSCGLSAEHELDWVRIRKYIPANLNITVVSKTTSLEDMIASVIENNPPGNYTICLNGTDLQAYTSTVTGDSWYQTDGFTFNQTFTKGGYYIIIDGSCVNGTLSPSGYLGFTNRQLLPTPQPLAACPAQTLGGTLNFVVFSDNSSYVDVGTGPDAVPSFATQLWAKEYGTETLPEDEYQLHPVEKPKLEITSPVVINTNKDIFIEFRHVALDGGITFYSPGAVQESFVGVRPDGTFPTTIPNTGIAIKFSDICVNATDNPYPCVNGTLDYSHNLITAQQYGVYVCWEDTNSGKYDFSPFWNKLYIEKNIIANFPNYNDNSEKQAYGIYLCDRNYFNLAVNAQRNIYIKYNLLYKVPNGIYIGFGNQKLAIKENTIALRDTVDIDQLSADVEEWYTQALKNVIYVKTIPGFGAIHGAGIDMPQGGNKDIGIGFNYIYWGNRGIRVISWPTLGYNEYFQDYPFVNSVTTSSGLTVSETDYITNSSLPLNAILNIIPTSY